MHAISSYSGNRPTNKQTHRQDRLQYTAPLSLARSVIIIIIIIIMQFIILVLGIIIIIGLCSEVNKSVP